MRPRVLIRQELDNGIGRILNEDQTHYRNFRIFGMYNKGLDLSLLDDSMPKVALSNYNKILDGSFVKDFNDIQNGILSIQDYFERLESEWLNQTEWSRSSNRYQTDMCHVRLDILKENGLLDTLSENPLVWDIDQYMRNGYYKLSKETDNRPDGVPEYDKEIAEKIAETEHRRWNAERKIAGWRKPGPGETRLDAFYLHPCIIPFDQLDDDIKYNDIVVFRAMPLMDYLRKRRTQQ